MDKFEQDCMATHGKKLNGRLKHWCANWDFLPIDETCPEFDSCTCYSEGTKEKYDEFVKMRETNRGNMVDKTERKNENRKIYIVESVSMFRMRHAVFATCAEDAADEHTFRAGDTDFIELSQEHIGENIVSIRKVSEEEYLEIFDEDNGDWKDKWSKEHKLSSINVIDYEEDK